MTANQKYSVWIPIEHPEFRGLTAHLAKAHGGPDFVPHVTVIGGLQHLSLDEIIEKCAIVAQKTDAFEFELHGAHCGSNFFQCVYILTQNESSLRSLHEQVRAETYEAMGVPFVGVNSGYMPHVSVFYGEKPEEDKRTMLEHTTQFLQEQKLEEYSLRVKVTHIDVMDTDLSNISGWECVKRIPLRGC